MPQDPKTMFRTAFLIGGEAATTLNNEMNSATGNNDPKAMIFELRIGVEAGSAEEHANDL